ncbi:Hypothetical_protein [Hexamita inflata]|uniref:Hypothetical_protein n=1 Tax=Hexamita inflata TaxID=28002 RepID=A0AA86PAV2_9EUKA|nr:Hypothetical protein HINF_LOCUS21698 [Hexamita inflata]
MLSFVLVQSQYYYDLSVELKNGVFDVEFDSLFDYNSQQLLVTLQVIASNTLLTFKKYAVVNYEQEVQAFISCADVTPLNQNCPQLLQGVNFNLLVNVSISRPDLSNNQEFPNMISFFEKTTSKRTVGIIVGCVLGAVVFISALIIGICCCAKKKRTEPLVIQGQVMHQVGMPVMMDKLQ